MSKSKRKHFTRRNEAVKIARRLRRKSKLLENDYALGLYMQQHNDLRNP